MVYRDGLSPLFVSKLTGTPIDEIPGSPDFSMLKSRLGDLALKQRKRLLESERDKEMIEPEMQELWKIDKL